MIREIKTNLYKIKMAYGPNCIVECDNEKELCEYVFNLETKGCYITSVSELNLWNESISTPKVAIKSNPYYKQLQKEYFKNK